jgi:hypothetical protein
VHAPRLVASDIDGTLLDQHDRLTDRTRGVIAKVVAAGVPFVLVTGRPPRWVTPITDLLGPWPEPTVCANGAIVYDVASRQVLHSRLLAPDTLSWAARAIRAAVPGSRLAVERVWLPGDGDRQALERPFLAEPGYLHPWPGADAVEAPLAVIVGRPATKLLVRMAEASSEELAAEVGEVIGEQLSMTWSASAGLLELGPPGVTKAGGLALVAARHGVTASEVVAFGDMPNDLAMIDWAGHGVAMGNGHPALRAIADEVAPPNSADGVAAVLERWF